MKQVTVLFNGRKQATYLLDEPHIVIGRGRSAHIPLDGNPIVSRQHAVIRSELDAHVLEDLGGANGTFVNDEKVNHVRLRYGDRVTLGKHTLRYEVATAEAVSLKRKVQPTPDEDSPATGTMQALSDASVPAPAPAPAPSPMTSGRRGPAPPPWSVDGATPAASSAGLAGLQMAPGTERTVAASREELEVLLAQMKVKSGPHLSINRKGKIHVVPLDLPPVLVGHTVECVVQLEGRRWFGKVAAALEESGGSWWLVARSPFWNPVLLGGKKVRKKRKLMNGATITAGGIKFRFSLGETE